jgi:hypothetical protein
VVKTSLSSVTVPEKAQRTVSSLLKVMSQLVRGQGVARNVAESEFSAFNGKPERNVRFNFLFSPSFASHMEARWQTFPKLLA